MNKVRKQAKQFFRSVKGDLSYMKLKEYIKHSGFIFVSMNTEKGDKLLKRFCIYDNCIECDGHTIGADGLDFVVIDDTLTAGDKIRVMLHEIYHMENHCDCEVMRNGTRIQRDNEAEAFAYEVISLQNSIFNLFKRKEVIV